MGKKKSTPPPAPNPLNDNPYLRELMGLDKSSPVTGTGDTQGIYVPGGLDKYTKDISPNDVSNIDDYRGERQSTLEKLSNGAIKAVGKTGLRIVDSFATIPYLLGAGMLSDKEQGYLESIYNNPISLGIEDMINDLNNDLPNYYTNEEKESLKASLTGMNFWADKFLDGASYAASAFISGYLGNAGISGVRNVLGNLGKGKTLLKSATVLEDAVEAVRDLQKSTGFSKKLGDYFQQTAVTTLASAVESSTEARGTYQQVKDSLINEKLAEKLQLGDNSFLSEEELEEIENKAVSAGNINFGMNMLMVGATNQLQFGKYFSNAKYSNTAVNRNRIVGDLGESTKTELSKSAKFFGRYGDLLSDAGGEYLQETGQMASNELLADYYTAKSQNSNQLVDSFMKSMHSSFMTKEGWEAGLLGAFIGSGTNIAGRISNRGNLSESEQKEKAIDEAVRLRNKLPQQINEFIGKNLQNLNTSFALTQEQMEAAKRGDKFSYLGLAALDLHNMVSNAVESNSFDDYIANLESIKDLSEDQFKDKFGVDSIANKDQFVDEMIEKSNALRESYSRIKNVHGSKLNNDQIGVVATVASIADDAVSRQNQVFEKLKTEFDFDIQDAIFNRSVAFDKDFDILNDLNKSLTSTQSEYENTNRLYEASNKKDVALKSRLKDLSKSIADITNDIEAMSISTDEIVDEANYRDRINSLSTQTKNKINERAIRKSTSGILNPTRREEFETLLSDFNRLENQKSDFIDLYNKLVSKDYQKHFDALSEKIKEREEKNVLDSMFTIKTPNAVVETDANGNKLETITDNNLVLDTGLYNGNAEAQTYVSNGVSNKVDTPNNLYEIKERRIRNTPSGKNIAEVKVSINGQKDKWIPVSKLKFKKLQKIEDSALNAETVFYNKYKDRLITIQYEQGYSDTELNAINQYNKDKIQDNADRINNGENIELNEGIIVGGKKNNLGEPIVKKASGFMGLDRNGKVVFRVWNPETSSFEVMKGSYLSDIDSSGQQKVSNFSFKVSQDNTSTPGNYTPYVKYSRIGSRNLSQRYLMALSIGKRIDEVQSELDDLLNEENPESLKNLKKQLKTAKNILKTTSRQLVNTTNRSKFLILNKTVKDLQNVIDDLNTTIEEKQTALNMLKQEAKFLSNHSKDKTFTEKKLIKQIKNLGLPNKLNASLIIDQIEKTMESDLKALDILNDVATKLKSNIAQNILDNYGMEVDAMLDEAGIDPTTLSNEDKLEYLATDISLTLQTLGINDLQLEQEAIDLSDIEANIGILEQGVTDQMNDLIESDLGFKYPFDSLNQLKEYAENTVGIDPNLISSPVNPIEAKKQLQIAALESELAAYRKLKQDAFYDQRLENKGNRSHTVRSEEYTEEEIETSDLDDSVTEADSTTPSVFHNGPFNIAGREHMPFMKTTNPNVDTIEDTDDNTKKSKFIFNNAVLLLDESEYSVEITDTLADEKDGDSSKYPVSEKAKGSLYAIIVDKDGNRVKFNTAGVKDDAGLIAHAVLPTESLFTISDSGEKRSRFHDINELTDDQKTALNKSVESFKAFRENLHDRIAKGERIFYSINSKSMGVKKTSPNNNKLKDVINADFTDVNQNIVFGTGLTTFLGGTPYPTYPGKYYYTNNKTKQAIPLKGRKINNNEIDNIVNALIYFNNNSTPEASQDAIINSISTYLLWGAKPKKANVKYEIYFTPDSNASSITFSGFYKTEEGKNKKVQNVIPLSELENEDSPLRKDFINFLSGVNKQVYPSKLSRSLERTLRGTTPNTYSERIFTRDSFSDITYPDYASYVLDSDSPSLSSNMITNSNTGGIIKAQWVGSYLRLGDEIKGVKLERTEAIASEPKMTDLSSDAYTRAANRIKERYGINVSKVTGLIDNDAYGMFVNSSEVLLSDEAPVGTDYHEEFHIVEDLYLTEDEKHKVYNEWRSLNNENATDREVSEALAEEFRYYSVNRELKENKNKGGVIEMFIKSLFDFVNKLMTFNRSTEIKNLFDAIYDGKLTMKQKSAGYKFSVYQMHSLNKSISNTLAKNKIKNATIEEYRDAANDIKDDFLRNKTLDNINELYDYYNSEKSDNILDNVFDRVTDSNEKNESENNILGLPTSLSISERERLRNEISGSNNVNEAIGKLKQLGTSNALKLSYVIEDLSGEELESFENEIKKVRVGEDYVSGLIDLQNKVNQLNEREKTRAYISEEDGYYAVRNIVGEETNEEILKNRIQQIADKFLNYQRKKLDNKEVEEVTLEELNDLGFSEEQISNLRDTLIDDANYGGFFNVDEFNIDGLNTNNISSSLREDYYKEKYDLYSVSIESTTKEENTKREVEISKTVTNFINDISSRLDENIPVKDAVNYYLSNNSKSYNEYSYMKIRDIYKHNDVLNGIVNNITDHKIRLDIDEIYSINPELAESVILNNIMNNVNPIYNYISEEVARKIFNKNPSMMDISNLRDFIALTRENVPVFDNLNFDSDYGIVDGRLYKRLSEGQYISLRTANDRINRMKSNNIVYEIPTESIPVNYNTRLNKLNLERTNC